MTKHHWTEGGGWGRSPPGTNNQMGDLIVKATKVRSDKHISNQLGLLTYSKVASCPFDATTINHTLTINGRMTLVVFSES